MKSTPKLSIFMMFASIMILIFASPIIAGEAANIEYLDLDGDGLNDNIYSGIIQSTPSPTLEQNDIFGVALNLESGNGGNSAEFGQLMISARALTANRCSLDSDAGFGPGNGLGSGIVKGGMVCEGGVCRPY